MAIQRFTDDVENITKLSDSPSSDGSLTTEQFKAEFDKAAKAIKAWINNVLCPAVDAINAGAVIVSDTKPSVTPALWLDTSNDGGS